MLQQKNVVNLIRKPVQSFFPDQNAIADFARLAKFAASTGRANPNDQSRSVVVGSTKKHARRSFQDHNVKRVYVRSANIVDLASSPP